jgi:hypothetical protein
MALKITVPPGYTVIWDKSTIGRVLRGVGNEVASFARAAIRAGAATKKRAARRAAKAGGPPVGRTGNLARNIKVTLWRTDLGVTVRDTARAARGGAPYALFLEKGAQGGVGSGRKGVKGRRNQWKKSFGRNKIRVSVAGRRVLAPHPFLEPAAERAVADDLAGRVREAMLSGLKFRRGKP